VASTRQQQDRRKQKQAAAKSSQAFPPATELTIQDFASAGKPEERAATAAAPPVNHPPEWGSAAAQQEQPGDTPVADWQVEQLPLPSADEGAVSEYQLPPLSLLNRPFRPRSTKQNQDIYENSQTLENTLDNFGIKARVVQATKGPAVTRYEIQTAPGTKVSRVTSLADDIALSLACSEVRIEAPIPGKAAIGIEVPNKSVSPVLLRDVLESPQFADASGVLTVGLGKDIAGQAIVANLADMPHLLIAGATGSGKSVCINAMIASILYKATPQSVRFLMIDPKVVELASYNGIPHLLAPVVNNPKKAAAALKWATGEMERRYASFAKAGVRDVTRYNEWAEQSGKEPLPLIVIIIDELADLMMVARADVEDAICRLAQMARACGMHLVIGTQRPSTDVITGLIKANIPSRISFAVSSGTDSRVILDIGGAEKLLGKGDMLFAPVGIGKPLRVQGAFVSNREIEKLVEFVGNQMEAQYVEQLCRIEETGQGGGDEDRDELFVQAANVVVEAGQASVSLLQRRLRVGYTRAARIVDQLESAGIVGPYEGSKPRQVFKNRDVVKSLIEAGKRAQTM
jgi:S-DNA-T family DNA segregation ATPase FtsK/SpoIIIE